MTARSKGPAGPRAGGPGGDKEFVTGRKPVAEMLASDPTRVDAVLIRKGLKGRDVGDILDACGQAGVRYKFVDQASLNRIHRNHQGVAAQVSGVAYVELDGLLTQARQAPLPVVCALDQVQDTGNVGALARTLWGLGAGGLMVVQHGSAYLGAGAVRASAGCILRLPVARVVNLSRALGECKQAGFTVYGAARVPKGDPEAARRAVDGLGQSRELMLPAVLVLGNEDKGVRPGVLGACDFLATLPMRRQLDSYNVSQAGAMLLAGFARAAAPRG